MKNIVVGITGGIAIYKVCELLSALKKKCYNIDVIMTENATKFINPLTFSTITKNNVSVSTFDTNFTYNVEHVSLAKKADLFIIVPATANVIAKIAHGLADDLLTTTFLASTCPKIICPAMNTNMYLNKITIDNINKLKEYNIDIIKPETGLLACKDIGIGKLANLSIIKDKIEYYLHDKPLLNKKILISAGPTIEYIDPIRYISNHSSGKMGYAIAKTAAMLGAKVTLVSGQTNLEKSILYNTIDIISSNDMYTTIKDIYQDYDYIIMASAVCDYKYNNISKLKLKKQDTLDLNLTKTIDILKYLGEHKLEHQILCGFAMESDNLINNAKDKLINKNLNMIVANDINVKGAGFNVDTNVISIITKDNIYDYPIKTKIELSYDIIYKLMEI